MEDIHFLQLFFGLSLSLRMLLFSKFSSFMLKDNSKCDSPDRACVLYYTLYISIPNVDL